MFIVPSHFQCPREQINTANSSGGSRSSCSSDCSECLSLQESGIFDGHGSDSGSEGHGQGQPNLAKELSTLTCQIEGLLNRYKEEKDEDQEENLSYCKRKISDFERRLEKAADPAYLRTLEDKVNNLLVENKRLEEARAEMEESENDHRNSCQR